jgi:hypothetical protein
LEAVGGNPKSETRNPKDKENPKSEKEKAWASPPFRISDFEFRISFGFLVSDSGGVYTATVAS